MDKNRHPIYLKAGLAICVIDSKELNSLTCIAIVTCPACAADTVFIIIETPYLYTIPTTPAKTIVNNQLFNYHYVQSVFCHI